jgi:carboxylesterase type B
MKCLFSIALIASVALATPYHPRPFDSLYNKRQVSTNSSSLQVDLGYTIYEGYSNSTSGLNIWKGIRYASPLVGELRWQAPQPPFHDRSTVIQATSIPYQCPQSSSNEGSEIAAINETFITSPGSEDCLFLNIFSPQNATNLPVFVWIHGGGYGEGNGGQDLIDLINTNNNSFVGVAIQYRLGAFGFLSSDEVNRFGVVNVRIRD